MIVFNVTIKIIPDIEDAWVQWQLKEHIPAIMALGLFTGYQFYCLLEQDDTEGSTYVIQFFAPDLTHYQRYLNEHASAFQQRSFDKWGDRYISFRTVMQIVK